jgi:hypothetical protein
METGPLTLIESWDQGTPIVGIDRGGIRDFLVDADLPQCLFNPDDVEGAVAAIKRLFDWNGPPPVVSIPGMQSRAARVELIYRRACATPAEQLAGAIG